MNRNMRQQTHAKKRLYPSDKQIQSGFEKLFVNMNNREVPAYTSASEFARSFRRCTLFEETAITTTAHVGV